MQPDFFLQMAIVPLCALLCGLIFERLRQPAVLGYILAGVLLGPSVLDLVNDRVGIEHLAELGVQMLLFLVGMELSLRGFKKVWVTASLCTALQLIASFGLVYGLGMIIVIPSGLKLLLSFAIALSSTAVAIKMLESIGELRTDVGRMTIGILIAQDLALLPIMLLVGNGESGSYMMLSLKVVLSIAILATIIWYFSRREKVHFRLLERVAKSVAQNPELRPIVAMVFCFGTATIAGLLDLSPAYGAFLGGLIIGNTADRHEMVQATKPLQTILMMVFFLSIGLLMDLGYIVDNLGKVMTLLFFITIVKTGINISILHFLNQPWSKAFLSGVLLAQMGELSFLLTTIGLTAKLIDPEGANLIISLAALSLVISPLWMSAARKLHDLAPHSADTIKELFDILYGKRLKAFRFAADWLFSRAKKPEELLKIAAKPAVKIEPRLLSHTLEKNVDEQAGLHPLDDK